MSKKFRSSLEYTFMDIAHAWSRRSTCSSRIAVGAVLVNGFDQVIASGYNGAPRGMPHCDDDACKLEGGHCISAIHAEENAILQCAINGVPSRNCAMFVTHSPCPRCALRIVQAGIGKVVFAKDYKDIKQTAEIFENAGVRFVQFQGPTRF